MMPLRYSLRMALTSLFLAALTLSLARSNSWWLLQGAIAVLVVTLCLGLAGTICAGDGKRAFWVGVLVFGYAYGCFCFPAIRSLTPFQQPDEALDYAPLGPALMADDTIHRFVTRVPGVGDTIEAEWTDGNRYEAVILELKEDEALVQWMDGSSSSWVQRSSFAVWGDRGRAAAQAMLAVLIAYLGGCFCRAYFMSEKAAPRASGGAPDG